MDCDHCQQLLLDLACGEPLAPSNEGDARTHAATCPTCEPALRKLERALRLSAELPLLDPSEKASARIIQIARNHALTARTLVHSPIKTDPKQQPWLDRLRVFLSQFAMGRQVAMATVMVLVTAVGFWFVPRARQHDLAGGNVVNPDPEGEAGPSKGIVPAAPLDLDLRQGRIRARGYEYDEKGDREVSASNAAAGAAEPAPGLKSAEQDVASATEPTSPGEPAPSEIDALPEAEAAEMRATADDAHEEKARAVGEGAGTLGALAEEIPAVAPARSAARKEAPTIDEAFAMTDTAPAAPAPSAPAPSSSARASSAVESEAFAPAPAPTASSGAAGIARRAQALAPRSVERNTASESTGGDALPFATESFRAGNYQAAIDGFESVRQTRAGQLPASARLSLARSYGRTTRCDLAISHYEIFLRASPRHAEAMLELAACYRQLGRTSDAARWAETARDVQQSHKTESKKGEPASALHAE